MKINNVEFDFRITNLKHAAAFELALQKMGETEKKIRLGRQASAVFADTIGMFRTFFMDATGTDVLADCEDFMDARNAYMQFLKEINVQKNAALAPYDPESIK